MRIIFIVIALQFSGLTINAQVPQKLISNNWYFSGSDSLFFFRTHLRKNKVTQVEEYRTDKKYADSAQLMSEYSFDTLGSLIRSKTYDIHGAPSITEFKIAPNSELAEVWVGDKNGVLVKTIENIYSKDKLIKQISYYGKGHVSTTEYSYTADGLMSSLQYLGVMDLKGANTTFAYDSLNRLVLAVTKNPGDSVGFSYLYKYDKSGRRFFTEYKEQGLGWTETIDYSKSTTNSIVARIYFEDKLKEIQTKVFNRHGLIIESIIDKRMDVEIKQFKRRNTFCGYEGPARYQKTINEYDPNGNLISEKEYFSPNKINQETKYSFDSKGNLIHKVIFIESSKDSEWSYRYN